MKLTPKQKKFADEYIKTGNATQSAIEAGYSKKTAAVIATENLIKPNIKAYIEKCMAEIASNRVMSYTEAVELLTSIARGEEKETVVVSTPIGVEEVEKEPDTKTRIIAVREILKRYPNNDKLVEQQIRKLSAEADIAEANAREVTDNGTANEIRVIGFDRRAEEDERS
ncbi:terminase [Leuconostoc mesenteroides subsp. dextranicum]|jgi:Phage terminase, small subunit|uniref:terminase small subunit n=1 Tax=Leuconostoc mesenteroides TaxID=1245 RepID=UPI0006821477|nr:terminase small subunit [Leuconostoc mesenteroides]KMY80814.1 terminase [Leuconostoc mesenteroides subsp. dextranicum]